MATLGITSENFYDMSPVELYHALKSMGERRKFEYEMQTQIVNDSMRLQAWLLINHQPGRTAAYQYKRAEDLIGFRWDKKLTEADLPKQQTPEQMKDFLLDFAKRHNERIKKQSKIRTTPPLRIQREMLKNREKMVRTK